MGVEANGIAAADHVPVGCYFSGKPILDVELSERPECFVAVTTEGAESDKVAHNLRLVRLNTRMDFLFIVLYLLVFILFAHTLDGRWTKWTVIGLIFASAALDVGENLEIFKGLARVASSSSMDGSPATGLLLLQMGAARSYTGPSRRSGVVAERPSVSPDSNSALCFGCADTPGPRDSAGNGLRRVWLRSFFLAHLRSRVPVSSGLCLALG